MFVYSAVRKLALMDTFSKFLVSLDIFVVIFANCLAVPRFKPVILMLIVGCEGMYNPLEGRKFHELSFYQCVCMLKALCEHCVVGTYNIILYNIM